MNGHWSRRGVLGGMAALGASAWVGAAAAQGTASQGALARIKAAGVLRVGLADNIPWSKLNPDGSVIGIAPQQIEAVAKRLGIPKVEGIVGTYGQLVPGLLAGRWDMVGASLTITTERCAQVLFSDPFHRSNDASYMAILPGSLQKPYPTNYTELVQRFDKMGIASGSSEVTYWQQALEKTGSKMEIVQFPDALQLVDGLLSKRVPVVTADRQTLESLLKQRGGFELAAVATGRPNRGSGAAFRLEDREFRDAFVKEQRVLRQAGEVKKILNQYGFEYEEEYMNISGDEACKL